MAGSNTVTNLKRSQTQDSKEALCEKYADSRCHLGEAFDTVGASNPYAVEGASVCFVILNQACLIWDLAKPIERKSITAR